MNKKVLSEKEIENVLRLPAERRYQYFVANVASFETAWGLYDDGWAMAATKDGVHIFPVWPAEEFATLCARDEWSGYQAKAIDIEDLVEDVCGDLADEGTPISVFYLPQDRGVVRNAADVANDLRAELAKYE